jgi:hypothetical protein
MQGAEVRRRIAQQEATGMVESALMAQHKPGEERRSGQRIEDDHMHTVAAAVVAGL